MRFRPQRVENTESAIQRVEAFSDGIFAIAITLLILDIRIPHLTSFESGKRLTTEILAHWPSYFAFVFSFITVGIYWANHQYIFRMYKATNHAFYLINVLFLMGVSFLPLPTAVLGEYMLDPNKRQAAIVFYNVGLLLPALMWSVQWLYASRNRKLIDPRLSPRFIAFLTKQYLISNAVYVLAIAAALYNGWLGIIISVGHTCVYLLPPRDPEYVTEGSTA